MTLLSYETELLLQGLELFEALARDAYSRGLVTVCDDAVSMVYELCDAVREISAPAGVN